MLEKKIRNPFVKMGKVYKYEFIHASKTLVPMYVILILLGLIIGLLQSPMSDYSQTIVDNDVTIESMEQASSTGMFIYDNNGETQILKSKNGIMKFIATGILAFIFGIYSAVVFVMTIVVLSGRFKKSMLGEEAYLNLVLPVTMGEHIWGRFLSSFTWVIIGFVSNFISIALCMIRNKAMTFLPEILDEIREGIMDSIGISLGTMMTLSIVQSVLVCMSIILLVYAVNSLGSLNPKNKTIIKLVSAIVLIIVQFKIDNWILECFTDPSFLNTMIVKICCSFFLCAVYLAISQLIFSKRLNLE